MARNKPCDIDDLVDQIVDELGDRMSRDPPDKQAARTEIARLLREHVPQLWEWSSQEGEIERLKTLLAERTRPPV